MNPGIYYDIPNSVYHGLEQRHIIGCSGLKAVLQSPADYYGQFLDPDCPPESDKSSAARDFGNRVHCMLFENHLFAQRYAVGPEVATRALKEWKDFASRLPAGCEGIKPSEYKTLKKVREQALAVPDVATALQHPEGRGEVSAYWVDEETGVPCKVRPDWVYPVGEDAVVLLDGKTFATADPYEFGRQAARMEYHLQAAYYSHGYKMASGKRVLAFVFLVISDTWPHLVTPVMLDEEAMRVGALSYRIALDRYAECKASGKWPGYGNDVKIISLPRWATDAV